MSRSGIVFKGDIPAATLAREPDGVTAFSYRPEYLEAGARPVATTLPLSDRPRIDRAGGVPPYFAGLLPEGRRLTALRREIKVSADDELALLLAIGSDLVGDVRVLPDDQPLDETIVTSAIELDENDDRLDFGALLTEVGVVDQSGIAGVQDKVSARMISLPVARANERYILKLSPPEYPHVVENEAFFVALARSLRIEVVDARMIRDARGVAGLLVKRFDRPPEGGRLAVEDAGQALNIWPADKYNVTMEQVANGLILPCAARRVAAITIFRQVLYAWLTGNGDLHAKNMSIVQTKDGEWRVSPAYDLPSTVLYDDMTFALDVDGEDRDIGRSNFMGFASAIGLSERAASAAINHLVTATQSLDEMLASAALPFSKVQLDGLSAELDRRRRLMVPSATPPTT